jgi:threonine dehydrogenase-like Zn-dependent dehydrogenase
MIGTVVATNGQRFKAGDRVLAVPIRQRGLYERYTLSEERAIPLDPRRPPEQALLAQPLGTVIFAIKKLPTVLDRDVAIVGQGPIGQLFNATLRNLGAREIIGIDKLASRLSMSQQMGATAVVDSSHEDPAEAVRRITGGHLADVVVEAVGHEDQVLDLCIDLCAKYGRILSFGVPPATIDALRWRDLFYKNITVHTSVDPDFTRDFPLAMRWIGEGRIDLSALVTHRFPLAKIQTAFETFRDRKDGAQKVLVEFPRAK